MQLINSGYKYSACGSSAKDPVTVSRNEIIKEISYKPGNNDEPIQQIPSPANIRKKPQDGC